SIPLVDLFQNPFKPVALLDPETGKILPSQMPSIVLGQTFIVDTKQQMLELSTAVKGAVAIIRGIPGGASYRLLGDNYYNIDHWQQLLSRFQNWSEVLNKPETFPPSEHDHDEKYPRLIEGKIQASVIPSFATGQRFAVSNFDEMLNLPANGGDICRVKSFNEQTGERKFLTYILYGRPYNLDDWVLLEPPEGSVSSVNGKTGDVYLTASDVEAAAEDHVHEPSLFIKTLQGNNISILQGDDGHGNPILYWVDSGGNYHPFA
ncbi:MAG: hypothetical protein SFU98_16335, partial [Leptospiraceae bacterium]|nr:hypothetical protein [Leptospiraceae bacterium]